MEKSWHLSRRTFLRGAAAAIALPMVDAMKPLRAAATTLPATAAGGMAEAPVRMAFIYFPNGAFMRDWTPLQSGAAYDLPFSLTPLEPHRKNLLILSGLDKAASHEGDGHYAKTGNFLTGERVNKTTGRDISAGGVSVDQLAARALGNQTPVPSLELAIDPIVSGIDNNVGYTRLYASYISWSGLKLPVARELSPRAVYDRLFGLKDAAGHPSGARDRADDRLLLDSALEDANDLRKKLGRDDLVKLDEYLDSVRAVEKRLDFSANEHRRAWDPAGPIPAAPPPGIPHDYLKHVHLMMDLMVLAFWSDSTRVASFMFANDVSGRNFSSLVDGVKGGHHELSHHSNAESKIVQYRAIVRWHVEQYARMLGKMRSIGEGDRTLLDNSMIMFGSSMSDGNQHNPANLPILLGGRGGNTIHTGRHVASKQGTPLCNLYVSMLDRIGAPVSRFGDSTGRLAGLEG